MGRENVKKKQKKKHFFYCLGGGSPLKTQNKITDCTMKAAWMWPLQHSPPRGCSHRSRGDDPAGFRSVRVLWSARECLYTPSAEPAPPLVPSTGPRKYSRQSTSSCVISNPEKAVIKFHIW